MSDTTFDGDAETQGKPQGQIRGRGKSAVEEVRRINHDLIADLHSKWGSWCASVGIRHMNIVVVGGVQYKREIIVLEANVAIFRNRGEESHHHRSGKRLFFGAGGASCNRKLVRSL